MTIVSYYTLQTPYEDIARNLVRSLERHGQDHIVRGLPDRGSWVENCAQKSEFIRSMAQELDRGFWWLDADAVLCGKLPEFAPDVDIAVHIQKGWDLVSSTMYFGATPGAKRVVERWRDICRAVPEMWDQVSLNIALHNEAIETPLNVVALPVEYCKIRKPKGRRELETRIYEFLRIHKPAVVRQTQASRTHKEPERDGRAEFASRDLPDPVRAILKERRPVPIDPVALVARKLGRATNRPAPGI